MCAEKQHIYLIDGTSVCYRAYYAIGELSASDGTPTNAVYGFVNILRKLIKEYRPGMMAVVFDMKAPTVKHKKYEEYKAHRKPMPDDLGDQIPKIKEIVDAYRIPMCQLEGYEADDIIATLAERAKKKGIRVTIVTSDKDALQLVGEDVEVLSPGTAGDKIYGISEVREKYGVTPEHMVDLMALTGDASDNIPGVKGIGRVAAGKLLKEYGTVEGIYNNIADISSKPMAKKLIEGKDSARLSRELVILDRNVPVDLDFGKTHLGEPDLDRLIEIYGRLEFNKLLKEIMPKGSGKTEYVTAAGEEEIKEILEKAGKQKMIAFSVADDGGSGGMAVSWAEGESYLIPIKAAKKVLEDEKIGKAGHDLKVEMERSEKCGVKLKGLCFDTMIADYLIDPARSRHDLEDMAIRHLQYNFSAGKGDAGTRLACERSDVIFRLYGALGRLLKEKHLDRLFSDVEMPLVSVLADMETRGIGVDIDYLKKKSSEMERRLAEISGKIYTLAGEEFNINSPKQLQVILYDKLGLPVTKRTKTGASTDESVLRKLADLHGLPKVLLEYRELNKLKTAYYDSISQLADANNHRLHTTFNQAVTATGRLSSSEPNLQNIPVKTEMGREIRRVFVSGGVDKVLLSADYSQVELRILAHLSSDKKLIEAFKKEEDVHRFTASLIFGCGIKDVTGSMRSAAKTVNFGIIYGMSAFGLAKDLGINVQEAQSFIDSYFSRYKGVKDFIDRTIEDVRKKGYVTTILKRRRYVPEINSANEHIKGFAERVAVNTPVQGSAADLIKLSMIECGRDIKGGGINMILQVHDELVFEVPEKELASAAGRIKKIMENVMELKVPLKVDVKAGRNWLDMEPVA